MIRSPVRRVIHAVAGSPVDPQLPYAFADWLTVAEQASLDTVHACLYPRLSLPVRKRRKPLGEHVGASGGDVVANVKQHCSL